MKKSNSVRDRYGWHFRPADGVLGYDDGRKPQIGERLQYRLGKRKPRVLKPTRCSRGMHASPKISQALHTKGPLLSFVLVEAALDDNTKFVGTTRTILWEKEMPADVWAKAQHLELKWFDRKDAMEKDLQQWAYDNGFRRASCRRRAAKARLTPVIK